MRTNKELSSFKGSSIMAVWLQEAVAAASTIIIVVSTYVLAVAGEALLT
jgi:CTP:molybdopterin cytidylyltransferase MocA